MMMIEQLVNNSWITGIGGSLFSGFVVFFVTRYFFSDRSQKELAQKATSANRDIIFAIRAGIPEGIIPTPDTVNS